MAGCKLCSGRITTKSPGLQCSGCRGNFHAKCAHISPATLDQLRADGVFWKCSGCRGALDSSVLFDDDTTDASSSANPTNAQLYRLMSAIQSDLKNLSSKYDEIIKSISFYGDKITDFECTLNSFGTKIKQVDSLVIENTKLRAELVNAVDRLDHLEQYSRYNNLIISGVPEREGENLPDIVSSISSCIKSPIELSDIDAIHRLPQKQTLRNDNKSHTKAIIVKFVSRLTRDRVIGAARLYRRSANGHALSVPNVSDNVYINEHLTAKNMDLLMRVRNLAKEKTYKYVWTRNSTIYVRRDDRAKVLSIKSVADLSKL